MPRTVKDLFDKFILPGIENSSSLEESGNFAQSEIEKLNTFLNALKIGTVKFNEQHQIDEATEDRADASSEEIVFVKPNEPQKKRGRPKKTLILNNQNPENADERSDITSEDRPCSTEHEREDGVSARPSETTKKRRRPKKTDIAASEEVTISDSGSELEVGSVEEGSSRSRRAAAQAADLKRNETETFMSSAKLRRPTDFDNKQAAINLCSPPTKTRKTCIGHSKADINSVEHTKKEKVIEEEKPTLSPLTNGPNNVLNLDHNKCVVQVEKLRTPRTSSKRKSGDLFNDSSNSEADVDDDSKSKKKGKTSSVPSAVLVQNATEAPQGSPVTSPSLPPCSNSQSSVEVTVKNTSKSRKETYRTNEIKVEHTEEIEQKTVSKNSANSQTAVVETESTVRSRTRVIRKKDPEENISKNRESDKENNQINNRTFVLDEETSPSSLSGPTTIKQTGKESKNKFVEETLAHSNIPLSVRSARHPVASPVKGPMVKKTVEAFEKMRVDEKPTTRVTRAKNRAIESQTSRNTVKSAAGSSKRTTSAERHRQTPLSNSRITPSAPASSKYIRGPSPSTRNGTANSACTTVIREEDSTKKAKENTLKLQQTKEEEERKKKQALRAKDEEKRKKEEHRQKVIAAREAREKEKALLAAKAEKEKEEKQQQLALEKEKQREAEQQRKKLLQQQRAQEQEDRRKQEEAARLAKLKEQEQEHKRIIAAKEREKELKKQQKAEEAQPSKTEKPRVALTKTVASASQTKCQNTPQPSTSNKSAESYEVTPARDDRPLLPSKTENDYGIDDANSSDSSEDEMQPKKQIPQWALPKNRSWKVQVDHYVPQEEKRLFMVRDPKPDLKKIFAGCQFKSRARTSSAVWNTPPRFNLDGSGK